MIAQAAEFLPSLEKISRQSLFALGVANSGNVLNSKN